MRFGRLILASLAAFAAYSYAQAAPTPASAHESLRLLQAVAPLFAASGDLGSTTQNYQTNPGAILPLEALTATIYGSSLVLLASFIAVDLLSRRHQRTLLRI